MNRALIDPRFNRVAQVIDPATEREFSVAPPLFWTDAADEVVADDFEFEPDTGTIVMAPRHPEHPERIARETEAQKRGEYDNLRRELLDALAIGVPVSPAAIDLFKERKLELGL